MISETCQNTSNYCCDQWLSVLISRDVLKLIKTLFAWLDFGNRLLCSAVTDCLFHMPKSPWARSSLHSMNLNWAVLYGRTLSVPVTYLPRLPFIKTFQQHLHLFIKHSWTETQSCLLALIQPWQQVAKVSVLLHLSQICAIKPWLWLPGLSVCWGYTSVGIAASRHEASRDSRTCDKAGREGARWRWGGKALCERVRQGRGMERWTVGRRRKGKHDRWRRC